MTPLFRCTIQANRKDSEKQKAKASRKMKLQKIPENANAILNNGGRVLGVTAIGDDLKSAQSSAYEAAKCIEWRGSWYRTDIADKAL